MWIGTENGNSVTEVSASTGALVRVIFSPGDDFDDPTSLAFYDGDVWTSDVAGRSPTGLSARPSALVRMIQLPAAGEIASGGGHLFMSGYDGLHELSTGTGETIKMPAAADDRTIAQMPRIAPTSGRAREAATTCRRDRCRHGASDRLS